MATFNYILGRKKDDGTYPVYLKIRHLNTNTMRSMGMSVPKAEWNDKSQRISIRRTDTYDVRTEKERNNEFLANLMIRAMEVENLLIKRGVLGEMTAKGIMDAILNYSPHSKQNEDVGNGDFVEYWCGVMMETPKSQEKYQYALKALINYNIAVVGKDSISFQDITPDWVRGFVSYIKNGYQYANGKGSKIKYKSLSGWSVSTYVACLKKVLNCAIDAGKIPYEVMRAFRRFNAGVVHKEPYVLNIEELRELLNYPFKTMRQRMVRDLFIFSFCTMGMNMEDIYSITKKEVRWNGDTGEIEYIRNKTNKRIVILINSCATYIQELTAPYCSANKTNVWNVKIDAIQYFGFYFNYMKYKTFYGNLQKVVREIRTIMGYPDDFTFYTARDSWASIMSAEYQLGSELVDAGLGHSSKSLADNHYIAKNYDLIYDAHEDVLRRLFEE